VFLLPALTGRYTFRLRGMASVLEIQIPE
jgi:hypothetical protein